MKRILGFAAALVLGAAAPSLALLGPETSVGIRMGSGSFESATVFGESTDIESPVVLGLTAGMRKDNIGWEISVEKITVDLETDIKEAELTMIPILLTLQIHPTEGAPQFDPYLGGGIGYYFNSAKPSSEAKALSGVPNYKVEVDDSIGFHLVVGGNLKVTSAVAFAIDARYALTSTDLTLKGGSPVFSDTININGLIVTAGLKYFFPK